MKNTLALIGLVVVLVVGLGWYLEWYKLVSGPSKDGHRTFNVDVNTNKVTEDIKTGAKKVGEVINDAKSSSSTPDRNVPGQPTGLQVNSDGSAVITLPKIEVKTGN